MRRPLDWPGDQVRKKADEQGVVDERFRPASACACRHRRCRRLPGTCRTRCRAAGRSSARCGSTPSIPSECSMPREGFLEEIEVLEEAEEAEIDRQRKGQQQARCVTGAFRAVDEAGRQVSRRPSRRRLGAGNASPTSRRRNSWPRAGICFGACLASASRSGRPAPERRSRRAYQEHAAIAHHGVIFIDPAESSKTTFPETLPRNSSAAFRQPPQS